MILNAVVDQLWRLEFVAPGNLTEPESHLLELLPTITPSGLNHGCLCSTEAEALTMALSVVAMATGRHEFLRLRASQPAGSGDVQVTPASCGLDSVPSGTSPLIIHSLASSSPDDPKQNALVPRFPSEGEILAAIEKIRIDHMAGIIAPPIDTEAGVIIPPENYWQQVHALSRRLKLPLIFDESRTGMNRTGTCFAAEHWNVAPDVLIVGGALGNGSPLSAVMISDSIAALKTTFPTRLSTVSPVACSAALAAIRFHRSASLAGRAERNGQMLLRRLHEVAQAGHFIKSPRGIGLLLAVDVVDEEGRPDSERCTGYLEQLKDWGFLFGRAGKESNTITILPPLTISDEQTPLIASALEEVQKVLLPRI